ncbi:LysE family translocator [Pseudomonas yangonensis]|uniref:LysE family translocator n=1 Tax=Pseudomonas yangonensis TaxID=2579922 RepID=UPI0013793B36|nr:LysE family translocator [Pseudomonas yangonensis]
MELQQLATFLPAAIAIACIPGANNLLSLESGARLGMRVAVFAVLGRCVAYAVMIGLVVAGLGQLLAISEWTFFAIKWLGVLYLAWIGIGMLRSRTDQLSSDREEAITINESIFSQARKDFLVAMGNPKAILLFSALLPQFVIQDSQTSYSMQMAVLGGIYSLVEWVTASLYAALGRISVAGASGAGRLQYVQKVSGCMLLCMAGALSLTRRSAD